MVTPERHSQAMEKVNLLVGVRERSVREMRERLSRAGFTQEEVEDAIETGLRVNLINEERFTRAYIRGKSHCGWGQAKIVQRLRASGITQELITLCSDEFPSSDEEYQRAMRELSKRSCSSKDPYASYMRRLVSRGYSYELSARAVRDHLAALS